MGKIKVLLLVFVCLIISCIIFLSVLNKKAMPAIMNYANVQTKKMGIEILRSAGTKDINKLLDNNELFNIAKNNNGEIESIDFNTKAINEALIVIAKNVRKRLKEVEKGDNLPDEMYSDFLDKRLKNGIIYEVPAGIVFNNSFLSNVR